MYLIIKKTDNEISPREKDVILLILQGYSNKQICDKLYISLNTVKTHIKNIFLKLNIKSRFELMRFIEILMRDTVETNKSSVPIKYII